MLRGRSRLSWDKRVVICVIGYLLLVISYLVGGKTPNVFAQSVLSVTATVALSSDWQQAIIKNSSVVIDENPLEIYRPIKIHIISRGLDNNTIYDQKIKITVLLENKKISQTEIKSNIEGISGFAYVPNQYGNYTFVYENISYEKPFIIQVSNFEIKKPSNLISDLLQYIFK
jgi:hypothetical protein